MRITKIQRIGGRRPRYGVFLDDSLAIKISEWTLGIFGLRKDDEVDKDTLERIRSTELDAQAKNIAINYISYRPRSSKEVTDHLIKKGIPRDRAEEVSNQLQSSKLINDIEFAYAFVRDRLKRKSVGQILLRQQLMAKGIPTVEIDRLLEELVSTQSQQTSAIQAVKKKLQNSKYTRHLDDQKKRKHMLDFLLRRGFTYEISMKAMRTTMGN